MIPRLSKLLAWFALFAAGVEFGIAIRMAGLLPVFGGIAWMGCFYLARRADLQSVTKQVELMRKDWLEAAKRLENAGSAKPADPRRAPWLN